jgi:hypothetical protein
LAGLKSISADVANPATYNINYNSGDMKDLALDTSTTDNRNDFFTHFNSIPGVNGNVNGYSGGTNDIASTPGSINVDASGNNLGSGNGLIGVGSSTDNSRNNVISGGENRRIAVGSNINDNLDRNDSNASIGITNSGDEGGCRCDGTN